MKIFQFITGDGQVEVKIDMLSSDMSANATIMDIRYNITNTSMTNGYTQQQAITNFQNVYPYFADIHRLVSSGAALKAIATTNNLTLNMYETASPINNDTTDYGKTVLNTRVTTTTTTTSSTTTTTT